MKAIMIRDNNIYDWVYNISGNVNKTVFLYLEII